MSNRNIGTSKAAIDMITQFTETQGNMIVRAWRDLLPQLITKFHDGYHAVDLDQPRIKMTKLFYPKWWLDLTGYFLNKPNTGPDTIMFASQPISGSFLFFSVLLTGCVSLLVGMHVGAKGSSILGPKNHAYEMINTSDADSSSSISSSISASASSKYSISNFGLTDGSKKKDSNGYNAIA